MEKFMLIFHGGSDVAPEMKFVSGPNKLVTDGPFAESKELVGGYFIVLAKDLDDAVKLTHDYPDFIFNGKVQVRPVQKIDM